MAHSERPVTLARLRELLDAYGASPARWPDAERDAARWLVAESTAAHALWEQASALDHLLDAVPAEAPSPILVAQVLRTMPRGRATRVWRRALVAVVPLAAAAALVLWIATDRQPTPQPTPQVARVSTMALGEYASPTDVLLQPYGIDVSANVPAIGCAESSLGCPAVERGSGPVSQRLPARRVLA